MKLLTIFLAITLASCQTIPVTVELPLPPELTLPKNDPSQLQCLSDEAYEKLTIRDKLQTERRMTLRSIIESTKGK